MLIKSLDGFFFFLQKSRWIDLFGLINVRANIKVK